jgi:hypothetical protein
VSVEGGFRLGNTAAASIGKEPVEEIAHSERADDRDDEAAPGRTANGIEASTKALRDQDEGDDKQSDERTDEESQDEEDLFLAVLDERSPTL